MLRTALVAFVIVVPIVHGSPANAGGPATGVKIDASEYAQASTADTSDDDSGMSSRDFNFSDSRWSGKGISNNGTDSNSTDHSRQSGFNNPIPSSVIDWGIQSNVYRMTSDSHGYQVPLPMTLQNPVDLYAVTGVVGFADKISTAPMIIQAWYGNNLDGGDAKTAEGLALRNYLFAVDLANDAQKIISTYTAALQMPQSDSRAGGVTPQQDLYMQQSIVNAQAALQGATSNMSKFKQRNNAAFNLFQLLIQPSATPTPTIPPTTSTQTAPMVPPNPSDSTNQSVNSDDN